MTKLSTGVEPDVGFYTDDLTEWGVSHTRDTTARTDKKKKNAAVKKKKKLGRPYSQVQLFEPARTKHAWMCKEGAAKFYWSFGGPYMHNW